MDQILQKRKISQFLDKVWHWFFLCAFSQLAVFGEAICWMMHWLDRGVTFGGTVLQFLQEQTIEWEGIWFLFGEISCLCLRSFREEFAHMFLCLLDLCFFAQKLIGKKFTCFSEPVGDLIWFGTNKSGWKFSRLEEFLGKASTKVFLNFRGLAELQQRLHLG